MSKLQTDKTVLLKIRTHPADIPHRFNVQHALKWISVKLRIQFVSEECSFVSNPCCAIGEDENTTNAFDRRRVAVAGQRPPSGDALDLVVANSGHRPIRNLGGTRLVAENADWVAKNSTIL
jgi:hypothetical protein